MNKTIYLKDSVYEICTKYPEVKELLAELGFGDITRPGVLSTAGRMMTLPRGASMKGIELSRVVKALQDNGFAIGEAEFSQNLSEVTDANTEKKVLDPEDRTELLKSYVSRLSRGESLDEVRKDFVRNFQSVDAGEIANAEQQLIMGGTSIYDVQRLCDVHSALFHGATREEQIANAELAVEASVQKDAKKSSPADIAGHPVNAMMRENEEIFRRIQDVRKEMTVEEDKAKIVAVLEQLHGVIVHYAKKADLIYPVLKTKYDVAGPAEVMWGVDDEIRDELKVLCDAENALPDFKDRLEKVLNRAEEMIYKENNILLPLCIQNFTDEDWMKVYYELPEYDSIFTEKHDIWQEAEEHRAELMDRKRNVTERIGAISLNSGHMTPEQIEAVLNTIPMEISFIDATDINCFFNAGKKLFKRPQQAIGREVYSCHPPKYATMARQIIRQLKSGKRNSVDVWLKKQGIPVLVRYMAVRNNTGEYVGTLECVQKMDFAEAHFRKQ